jgi:hypothetical protein
LNEQYGLLCHRWHCIGVMALCIYRYFKRDSDRSWGIFHVDRVSDVERHYRFELASVPQHAATFYSRFPDHGSLWIEVGEDPANASCVLERSLIRAAPTGHDTIPKSRRRSTEISGLARRQNKRRPGRTGMDTVC